MANVELEDLVFTRSFIFLNRSKRLRKRTLRHLLRNLAREHFCSAFAPVVRARLSLVSPPALAEYGTVSFLLGYVEKAPIFAKGQLTERLLSYVLIVERGNRAAIQVRHISTLELDSIFDYFDLSAYAEITSVFSDKANIVRLTSKLMNPARSGLTGRAFEGSALQDEMPQYGNGKSIPRSVKGIEGGETVSVTASASRITSYGQSLPLLSIGPWFKEMCDRLENNAQSDFLARFAEPIEFESAIKTLEPTLVVFDILALEHRMKEEGFELVKNLRKKGEKKIRRVHLTKSMIADVLTRLASNCRVRNHEFSLGKVFNGRTKLKLDMPEISRVGVYNGVKYYSLSTYINSKDLFSVYFNQLDHVHLGGNIFRDRGLRADVDAVLAALQLLPGLAKTDREKIDKNPKNREPLRHTFTEFPSTSVFDVVEKHFGNSRYIFCDDMGDEWADHMIFHPKPPSMTFVHSKHGAISEGASSLHIVVSQALKNLGNLLCTPKSLATKLRGFNGTKVKDTRISHIRKKPRSQTFNDMVNSVEKIASENNLSRHAVLACDFLSKAATTKNLNQIKANQPVSAYVHQQLWLLSYYVAACRELNVIPIILCQK